MVGCVIISGHMCRRHETDSAGCIHFYYLYVYVTTTVKKEEAVYFEGSLWQESTLEARKEEREMM